MRTTWTFHSAQRLLFGPGAALQLGDEARRLRLNRVLLVTDRNLVAAGVSDQVLRPLAAAGIQAEVFDGGQPEPPLEAVHACLQAARDGQADGLVALGGGSNIDLAKATAVLLAHGGQLADYFGDERVPGPVMPLICVPTTAGTGSEVSAAAVLTDSANQLKVGILSNYLRPALALVDPRLTLSCPPKVTADSGMDALTHAVEAYTAIDNAAFPLPPGEKSVYQGSHPMGDCLAERAIELVGRHLLTAVNEPDNLAAREGMALAAMLAGLAFSNVGVALVHAMEYPVGGAVHCSHGEGNGLLLPYVMRFNLPARTDRFARIAQLLNQPVDGLTAEQAAEQAVAAVDQLRASAGLRARLGELGVRAEQLPEFAAKAHGIRRILRVNPRPASVDDILAIYTSAL